MRAAILLLLAGCSQILGIDDPVVGGDDAPIDAPAACEDAAPYPGDPLCDPLDPSSCPSGSTCDHDYDNGVAYCRAIGGGVALQACGRNEDCGAGLICHFGTCRTYCATDCDCLGAEDQCHFEGVVGTFCDSTCDVSSTEDGGCGDGFQCLIATFRADAHTMCSRGEVGEALPPGATCNELYDCTAGYLCAGILVPGTPEAVCVRLCEVDGDDCGGGTCRVLTDESGAAMVAHGAALGTCQ